MSRIKLKSVLNQSLLGIVLFICTAESFAQGLELNVDLVDCNVNTLTYTYNFCPVSPSFDITCVFDHGDVNYSSSGGNGTLSGGGGCDQVSVTYTNLTDFYNHNFSYAWTSDWSCTNGQTRSASGSGNYGACSPPSPLSGSASQETDATCGESNGSFCANGSGGTGNYTYTPSQCLNNLSPGNYSITINDGLSSVVVSVTINDVPGPNAYIASSANITCNGLSNGTATAFQTSGTGPFTYLWSPSAQTTMTATGLSPNTTYTVTVKDANNCTSTATVLLTQPAILGVTATLTKGCTTYTGTSSVSGGTAAYSYAWRDNLNNFVGGSATLNSIGYGLTGPQTYTLTVTDAKGCTASATATLPGNKAPLGATWYNVDAGCGLSDGKAISYPTHGTPPYSFVWSNGSTDSIATGLLPGAYTYTVTDAEGCTNSATATVGEKAGPSLFSLGSTNVVCTGSATGSAGVASLLGTFPHSYSWSTVPVQTSTNATGLTAGTYTVQVTDFGGCTATQTFVITEAPTLLSISALPDQHVLCKGQSNGAATATASGGLTNYSYTWMGTGKTTASVTGLAAATYTVRVSDALGCSKTTTVQITEPAAGVTASATPTTHVLCFGNSTGSATASGSGGSSVYSYSWSNTQTDALATGLVAGTYTVTVTDQNNCSNTKTVVITQPAAALAVTATIGASVNCFGNATGSASSSVSGGTTAYSYLWSNGSTLSSATGLQAQTYTLTITDAHSCTTSATVSITQPAAALSVTIPTNTAALCNGTATGVAIALAANGTPNYNYSWQNTGVVNATLSNVVAGVYTVVVTDNNNCTITQTVDITQPLPISHSTASSTQATCGTPDATATVSAAGGTGVLAYLWSPSGGTNATATGLAADSYSVTITDANNCSVQHTLVITNLNGPTLAIQTTDSVQCYGNNTGSASVLVTSGGTTPFTYSWSNGVTSTSASASNLIAGTYNVQVTDAVNCKGGVTLTIYQPTDTLKAVVSSLNPIGCYGAASGSVLMSVTGGTSGYTYLWNTGQTTVSLTNVVSGTYVLTVTDKNNCTSSASATITQPIDSIHIALSSLSNIKCAGGSDGWIAVDVNGGTPVYQYSWKGSSYSSTTPDSVAGLNAGTYTLTVTDNNGCSQSIIKTLTQPVPLDGGSIFTTQKIKCNGDQGALQVSMFNAGGTTPYTYLWSNNATDLVITGLSAGSYSVVVTDANGCTKSLADSLKQPSVLMVNTNVIGTISCFGDQVTINATHSGGTPVYHYSWSNGSSAQNLVSVGAGSYLVTVVDTNGCLDSSRVTLTQPGSAVSAVIASAIDVKCKGGNTGSAVVSAAGGTSPYTYSWSNNDLDSVLSNVVAGIYIAVVTDSKSCSKTVTVSINEPLDSLKLSEIVHKDVDCFGNLSGSIQVKPFGGTNPYTYSWTNNISADTIASGLSSGSYTIEVTDKNGCYYSLPVNITQPSSQLTAQINYNSILCAGGTTTVSSIVTGGTTNYTYMWNGAASTNTSLANATSGSYVLVVTDAHGCTAKDSVFVSQPSSGLTASVSGSVTSVKCFGDATGAATINASGGTSGYSYTWNSAGTNTYTGSVVTNLVAGDYTVVVSDVNGCKGSVMLTISEPTAPLVADILASSPLCSYSTNGGATASATGGTPAYVFSWSDNTLGNTLSNIGVGTYTVYVSDANGCTATKSVVISASNASNPLSASFTTDVTFGEAPLNVNFTNTSANAVSYQWNFGDSTNMVTDANTSHVYTHSGEYMVQLIVTDSKGCVDTADVDITPYTIPNVFSPNADGKNDNFFVINAGLKDIEVEIYDRWGLKIYEYTGIHNSWDGRTLSGTTATDGTYYYLINVTSKYDKVNKHQGYLQLLR